MGSKGEPLAGSRGRAPGLPHPPRHDAPRQEQHDHHDDRPIHDHPRIRQPPQHLRQQRQDRRPDHGCHRIADAAEQRERKDRDRRLEPVARRPDERGAVRVERPRQSRQHRGREQRAQPVAADVHAHHLGRHLVLAHRLHRPPDPAAPDQEQRQHRQPEQAEDLPGLRLDRDAGEAERAAEIVDVEIKAAQHLAEPDRRDREIDARQPQRRPTDREREGGRCDARRRQHRPERPMQVQRQQRRGIGADAHERRLPKRELPDREHDIHRQRQQPVDPERMDQVLIGPEEIGNPAHARRTALRPNSPDGRVQRTATRMRKPTASLRLLSI